MSAVNETTQMWAVMARDYEALMEKVHGLVEQIDGPETALAALQAILAMKHVFASSVESQRALVDKTKVLGLTWVKDGPKQGEGHFEAKK